MQLTRQLPTVSMHSFGVNHTSIKHAADTPSVGRKAKSFIDCLVKIAMMSSYRSLDEKGKERYTMRNLAVLVCH